MRIGRILLFVVLLAMPVGAFAQEGPSEGAMLIILDASGSMNNVDEDGIPFIDKAKDAVLELIAALPDGMDVGLRVYGHREPNTDPIRGCRDTELLAPVAPLDREAIRTAVAGIEASGFTPIGLSLQEAADDLPDSGSRSIVLISDGEDTCAPPDPCRIAEELFGERFDVRIESVGFLIDTGSAAEQQLRCIAESTGGRYSTVGTANELVATLEGVTDELLNWRPPLTLNGALDQLAAPDFLLAPKADWLTDEPGKISVGVFNGILMPGETRWFRLDLWERENAWAWVDLEWPPGLEAGGHLEILVLDENGQRIETPIDRSIPLRTELPADSPMVGAAIPGPVEGGTSQAEYLVGLHWDAPPEVFLGSLSVTVEVLNNTITYLDRTELAGALDPADAPVLALARLAENGDLWRGGQFRGPLASGETRWYRVDLVPGEEMNTFALFPGNRYVGAGASGEFGVELLDLAGNALGGAHSEWPQASQAFGDERHQATVSGTVAPESATESVLIGFTWTGSPGQESEILFEAEPLLDPNWTGAADQIGADSDGQDSNDDSPPATVPQGSDGDGEPLASDEGSGGSGFPVSIAVGVLGVAALGVLLVRRLRSR